MPEIEKPINIRREKSALNLPGNELTKIKSEGNKDTEGSKKSIFRQIQEPMTRRNFLKIAAKAAIGLTTGYLVNKEIDSMLVEYQKEKSRGYEIEYTSDMTALYEKVKNLPGEPAKPEDVNKNIDQIEKSFLFAKFIKNSEKQNLDDLVDELIKKNTDIILFGEVHGIKSNAKNAVEILDKFKNKSGKKISKICLEFVDYKNYESIELIKKFNQKEITPDIFQKKEMVDNNSLILPLLRFAQENNIPIEGLEDKEKTDIMKAKPDKIEKTFMDRFTIMAHRLGEISIAKNKNEIIIAYSGSAHTDSKQWSTTSAPKNYLIDFKPIGWDFVESEKYIKEKDYTFKEYLEKNGFNPVILHLEDINSISTEADNVSGYTFNWLNNEEAEKKGRKWKEDWGNYEINQHRPFSVKQNDEKNIYFILNPSEVPKSPPAINVFETIKNNHPALHKIIQNKEYVSYGHDPFGYNMTLASTNTGNSIHAKLAEIDLKSGKPEKLYLPEQLKNNSSNI